MRRLLLILLLVFTISLHLSKQESMLERACTAQEVGVLSQGSVLTGQWLCEYIYNPYLSFTSVLQEAVEARSAVFMFQHEGQGRSRAANLLICCVTCGISGVAGLVARVHGKGFAAGLHAVDHYVYRLRRLII